MTKHLFIPAFILIISALSFQACDDNETPSLRAKLDYNSATPETPYSQLFVDSKGQSTVDLYEGNTRLRMFQAINYYSTSSIAANTKIDANKLKNMFANSASPFADINTTTITVSGSDLNGSGFQIRNVVGASKSTTEAEAIRSKIESLFTEIDAASNSLNATASKGVAGKLGSYLVDTKGIEIAQVIQKSLIGALQLDYIGNVLLDEGLTADNSKVVGDKNYTALEHNWDVAYGMLTLNQIYLQGATNEVRNSVEFGAGSYIWEYNKANYANIYPAYLKGRVAIVNNDKAELQKQATFIRTEFEKAIASAAIGYLDKWKTGTTDPARAHAIGEGLGFIYSLRFATVHNADASFSDSILSNLVGSSNGFWDLDVTKINTASDAIKAKFNL